MTLLRDCDVVIIGCGISGLSAGLRLLELNPSYSIAFIEARNRVGGRTKTQNVQFVNTANNLNADGNGIALKLCDDETAAGTDFVNNQATRACTIDVGGQWLGPMHTEMLSLVKSLGMDLIEQEYPNTNTNTDNTNSTSASLRLVECAYYSFPPLDTKAQHDVQKFHEFLRDNVNQMDTSNPLNFPNAKHLDTLSAAQIVNEMISSEQGRDEIYFYLQTILAISPSQCSWLFFLFYVASGGGVEALGDGEQGAQKYKVKGGAGTISQLMLNKIVMLSTSNTTKSKNNDSNNNNRIDETEKDKLFIHLQYSVQLIEQIIGDDEDITIENADDHYVKVVATRTCMSSTSNYNDTQENRRHHEIRYRAKFVIVAIPLTLSTTCITFRPPLPKSKLDLYRGICPGGVFKVVVCYPKDTIFGFGQCRPLKDLGFVHNIFASQVGEYPSLVGLITGQAADAFKDLDDEARKKAVFSQYATMYSLHHVHPIGYVIHDWTTSEKYSGGCFAGVFPPTSNATFVTNFHALKMPFGRIHFAGTETSISYYGYMEGARLSGLRAAMEVHLALTTKQ